MFGVAVLVVKVYSGRRMANVVRGPVRVLNNVVQSWKV
jgi:hypothetical protein